MALKQVRGLSCTVWYGGKDISARVDPYLSRLAYVDHLEGEEPDAIEVELEDRQRLFQGPLYPVKGSLLAFSFGFDSGVRFQSAKGFLLDEIEVNGPHDLVTWRATGNLPSGNLHTRVSKAWEGTTLEVIARSIARKHGLEVVANLEGIALSRVTQADEGDLAFLKRLAKDYGLTCSYKAGGLDGQSRPTLVLVGAEKLEAAAPIYEIPRSLCTRYRFRDKVQPGSRGAYTRYFDSDLKELVEFEVTEGATMETDPFLKGPVATLRGRGHQIRRRQVGNKAHHEVRSRRALRSSKGYEHEATLTLPGEARLRSGVVASMPTDGADGWGNNGGNWLVIHSRHALGEDGYSTELTVRRTL